MGAPVPVFGDRGVPGDALSPNELGLVGSGPVCFGLRRPYSLHCCLLVLGLFQISSPKEG